MQCNVKFFAVDFVEYGFVTLKNYLQQKNYSFLNCFLILKS